MCTIVDSCTCSTAAASFLKVIIKTSFLQVSIDLNAGIYHCKTKQISRVFSTGSVQCHAVFVFLT